MNIQTQSKFAKRNFWDYGPSRRSRSSPQISVYNTEVYNWSPSTHSFVSCSHAHYIVPIVVNICRNLVYSIGVASYNYCFQISRNNKIFYWALDKTSTRILNNLDLVILDLDLESRLDFRDEIEFFLILWASLETIYML